MAEQIIKHQMGGSAHEFHGDLEFLLLSQRKSRQPPEPVRVETQKTEQEEGLGADERVRQSPSPSGVNQTLDGREGGEEEASLLLEEVGCLVFEEREGNVLSRGKVSSIIDLDWMLK